MEQTPSIHELSAKEFISVCKSKFGWSDLSNDVIMDIGCGEHGYCGKAILAAFDVKKVIGIDVNPQVVRNFRMPPTTRMTCLEANIENRDTLRSFEGQADKVVSTHVFHQVKDKEEGFRNLYRLLKPGGEAAILFIIKSLIYDWLKELLNKPKWKSVYQGHFIVNLYEHEFATAKYREIAEKVGFQVVECSEEERVIPNESDRSCKDALYHMAGKAFKITPELVEEFKEESFQILLNLSDRNEEGKPCYRATELTLLLIKPEEKPTTETKENLILE